MLKFSSQYRPKQGPNANKGTLGDVKFKKIKFLQNIRVYIVWMTSLFFLSAEGENYP